MKRVWIGCSGWSYPHWRGDFYPKKLASARWLSYYSQRFSTVELNSTFYRLPSLEAARRWVEQTPDGFLFTVKASRYLTHVRRLRDLGSGIERFCERVEPLRESGKLGPVLWQLPANFHRDDELLDSALARLPPGRHAFEFRNAEWFAPAVVRLLREHRVALCIGDHPERPFQRHELTTAWTLIRFHFGSRGRDGNYSASELDRWRRRISAWRTKAEVFAYFNNDWRGFAPRNAAYLKRHLGVA